MNQLGHPSADKVVHTLPKGIKPKVNVIAQVELELANNHVAVEAFYPLHNWDTSFVDVWKYKNINILKYKLWIRVSR